MIILFSLLFVVYGSGASEPISALKDARGAFYFVPAAQLKESTAGKLAEKTPPGSWAVFHRLLAKFGVFEGDPPTCLQPPIGDVFPPPGEAERPRTLLLELENNSVAVLGKVVDLTPGWDFHNNGVATLVRLQIEEVLKDSTDQLSAGLMVTYTQRGGSLRAYGAKVCTRDPEYALPKAGDRVLLLGLPDEANGLHVRTHPSLAYYFRGSEFQSGDLRPERTRRFSMDDLHRTVERVRNEDF